MELTPKEILQNVIWDLEWAYQFIKGKCEDDALSEEEMKLDDMSNSIERLYDLIRKE